MVAFSCHAVAAWGEVATDEGASGQEALCLVHRLEPQHLPLSSPGRPMRVLRSVVQVAALAMLDVRQHFAFRHTVALQPVLSALVPVTDLVPAGWLT